MVFHTLQIIQQTLIKKYFDDVNTLSLTMVSTGTTFVASFLFAGNQLANSEHLVSPEMWTAICYMGLVTTSVSFLIWNRGVQILDPEKTALFLNLVPVFAFLSGLVIRNPWNLGQVIGGTVVIVAVFINFHFIKKATKKEIAPKIKLAEAQRFREKANNH